MKRHAGIAATIVALVALMAGGGVRGTTLEEDFANPPRDARLRAYWWWINGNVTQEAITRDLEQMKAMSARRTGRPSSHPSGANFTSTPCARRTDSAWR